MFHKKTNIEDSVDIQREAEKVYRKLKNEYKPIERKRRQIDLYLRFSYRLYENQKDELMGVVDGCYAVAEHYVDEVISKDCGLEVLKNVKQMAEQKIKEINHDYSQPADAKRVHEFVSGCAEAAISRYESFQFQLKLMEFSIRHELNLP